MESDSNQIEHLKYELKLNDSQWIDLLPLVKTLHLQKNSLLSGTSGDLFFVSSGFLVENQDFGTGELTMVRFFQPAEMFVYPDKVRDSQLCSTEQTVLVRIDLGREHQVQFLPEHLYELLEQRKQAAAEQYHKRQEFLSGRKYLRYQKFMIAFPGVASHLSNRQLAGYLDVNVTYLSTTKNSGRNIKH